ncbi:hypothetical protein QBC43DRAFT_311449 [Cladorrhinum sp. PSN259]|nr:hypothetical protein QBC43DRAFT_311449 [Cladorrhinum sp. PSN259]
MPLFPSCSHPPLGSCRAPQNSSFLSAFGHSTFASIFILAFFDTSPPVPERILDRRLLRTIISDRTPLCERRITIFILILAVFFISATQTGNSFFLEIRVHSPTRKQILLPHGVFPLRVCFPPQSRWNQSHPPVADPATRAKDATACRQASPGLLLYFLFHHCSNRRCHSAVAEVVLYCVGNKKPNHSVRKQCRNIAFHCSKSEHTLGHYRSIQMTYVH